MKRSVAVWCVSAAAGAILAVIATPKRGEAAYKATCLNCHGDHGKGGMAGPDLIRSTITMHDEDGVGYGQYLKGDVHLKAVKLDLQMSQVADIAAYVHSRVVET
jgi:mono/diheme cytochrome c family protein